MIDNDDIQTFIFRVGKIRALNALNIGGRAYFVGKDVADILGYHNASDALKIHVADEDKCIAKYDTPSGKQNLILINEAGLYSLILSSRTPDAKNFKRWVTSDVLPVVVHKKDYITRSLIKKFEELVAEDLENLWERNFLKWLTMKFKYSILKTTKLEH